MTLADTTPAPGTNAHTGGDETNLAMKIIFTVLVLLAAWGVSIYTWGVPGLYIPALAAVPFMYLLLVTIAKG